MILIMILSQCLFSQSNENQVYYELGDEFILVEDFGARFIYQTKDGVSFAFSAIKEIKDEENVPIVSAMSMLALSNGLEGFKMLYDNKNYQIGENIYSLFVYSFLLKNENVISYSFHTYFNKKLVNIIISYPEILNDEWEDKVFVIMNTIKFNRKAE